ncbi:MAG: metallophosphoesterase [Nanoarchaeota archaeon]|nr:metallophosphoesterase [Nanoarchaeota archaeon]
MKLLVLGDFHGKFPLKLNSVVQKEKIDLVVSVGDYPPFSLGKLFFKHIYGKKDVHLWDKNVLGKEKYKQIVEKDHHKGEEVLLKLDKLPVKVISVLGNHDYSLPDDVMDLKKEKNEWKWELERSVHLANFMDHLKNVTKIDYSSFKFRDYVFIGARGHSFPGRVKSRAYSKSRKKLEKLFREFSRENKLGKVVFVTHVPLYKTKLDLIKAKGAHKLVMRKHYGGKLFRRIVEKYRPILHLCGHIEEGKGQDKLKKTVSVNCGSIHHGYFAIVEIDDKKGKVKSAKISKIR